LTIAGYAPNPERARDDPSFSNFTSGRPELELKGSTMPWICLVIAGFLEIIWALFMKKSMGFTLLVPSAITIITMIASFALLSIAMRTLPLGTAYTVWTGIGAVGAFTMGVVVLGEPVTPIRMIAALLIVGGIVLIKLSSSPA
jgi:quaternary ammonium compound-resistance protein SugE